MMSANNRALVRIGGSGFLGFLESCSVFENLREDWATHEHDISRPGLWVMVVYRFGRWRYRFRHRVVRAPLSFVYKVLKVFSQIVTGIELPCEVTIGKRFKIWRHHY
jgi:serine O-acetyltransferase